MIYLQIIFNIISVIISNDDKKKIYEICEKKLACISSNIVKNLVYFYQLGYDHCKKKRSRSDQYTKSSIQSCKFQDIKNDDNCATECIICMESFIDSDVVIRLQCQHIYHKTCIKQWTRTSNTCPMCRKNTGIELNYNPGQFMQVCHLENLTYNSRNLNGEIVRIIRFIPETDRYRVRLNDESVFDLRQSNLESIVV